MRRAGTWHGAGERRQAAAVAAAIVVAGLAAYGPVLSFGFFWEDPFDIGQVEPYTYGDLLAVPNSNSYYRPLALVLLKALKFGGAVYQPEPYHAFVVLGHVLSAMLLFGLARQLFRRSDFAAAAATLFLLYPVPFEATARASSMHHWLAAATFASLWAYAWGRENGRRWPLWAALAVMAPAQTLHENGITFPALVLLLELWLVWQRRATRFSRFAFVYAAPALIYFGIWLAIPKGGEPPSLGLHLREALYLSQGLSYPIAGLFSLVGGFGLAPEWQAGGAAALALILLMAAHGGPTRSRLALALGWWLVAVSLAWLARPIEYLQVSPRVLYYPSFGAALAWAGLLDLGAAAVPAGRARRWPGAVGVAVVAVWSIYSLAQMTALYAAGSRYMERVIAGGAAAAPGSRLLYVNAPDRFEFREAMYPLGYWGMLAAPVSQELSDFVEFASANRIETRSLSEFRLLAAQLVQAPYRANTRGEDAGPETLYLSAAWADAVYLTEYSPDGEIAPAVVGRVNAAMPEAGCLARFGDVAMLCGLEAAPAPGGLAVTLRWRALAPGQPHDTVFVHVLDEAGELMAGADGDLLGGLLPLHIWQSGDGVVDVRQVRLPSGGPANSLRVGLYNRLTGERLPAADMAGRALPGAAFEIRGEALGALP